MSKHEKLNLIEGSFIDEDAKEILMNIFSTKIHFHEMKNFSSKERFGIPDEIASKRIPKLKGEIEKLANILAEAKSQHKKLVITSEINISLADE